MRKNPSSTPLGAKLFHDIYTFNRVTIYGTLRLLSTTSASIVRGTRVFQLKKTWNVKYDRATKNTIAPGIKWQKTYVNGLQLKKNLRKFFFSNQQK